MIGNEGWLRAVHVDEAVPLGVTDGVTSGFRQLGGCGQMETANP